jgi:hypothetical protein
MATRLATVTNVINLRGPDSMIGGETSVATYALFLDNQTGSSIIGGTDVFRVADAAADISAFVRDGKTRTVVGAGCAPFQHIVSSAGTAYGFTIDSSAAPQIDLTVKAASDWTTNATAAAGSFQQFGAIVVTVQES